MSDEQKPAKIERISRPRKAIEAIRQFKGYADIQHFYKSKLQYMQAAADKDSEQAFILGYN